MKKTILAILAFAAVGCGAPPEGLEAQGQEIELGTARQAIFLPNDYGSTQNQNECLHRAQGWQAGKCYAPRSLKHRVAVCAPMPGTDERAWAAQEQTAALGAAANWLFEMRGAGWDITLDKETLTSAVDCRDRARGIDIRVVKKTGNSPPGQTHIITTQWPLGVTDCDATQGGEFCQYAGPFTVTIKPGAWENAQGVGQACAGWAGATAAKRLNMMVNVVQHELYHVVGLGHTGQPGDGNLMSKAFHCEVNNVAPWLGVLRPLRHQMDALYQYDPRGAATVARSFQP
jgi:hypothetical protein